MFFFIYIFSYIFKKFIALEIFVNGSQLLLIYYQFYHFLGSCFLIPLLYRVIGAANIMSSLFFFTIITSFFYTLTSDLELFFKNKAPNIYNYYILSFL